MSVHSLSPAQPEEARRAPSSFSLAMGAPDRAETYTIWHVAKLVGCKHFGKERLLSYLRALIADHGFPRPLPAPVKKRAVADVHPESHWRAVAVDHWLDGYLPPDCHAALDAHALEAAAASMDHAAAGLGKLRAVG